MLSKGFPAGCFLCLSSPSPDPQPPPIPTNHQQDYAPLRLGGNVVFDVIDRTVQNTPTFPSDLTGPQLRLARTVFYLVDESGSNDLDEVVGPST